jgi:hypothetical protein
MNAKYFAYNAASRAEPFFKLDPSKNLSSDIKIARGLYFFYRIDHSEGNGQLVFLPSVNFN